MFKSSIDLIFSYQKEANEEKEEYFNEIITSEEDINENHSLLFADIRCKNKIDKETPKKPKANTPRK